VGKFICCEFLYNKFNWLIQTLLSQWTAEDVSNWLNNNHLETLIPLFRLHKIDGKELDRIREKNDSKVKIRVEHCKMSINCIILKVLY
jgi:hypothetical protein